MAGVNSFLELLSEVLVSVESNIILSKIIMNISPLHLVVAVVVVVVVVVVLHLQTADSWSSVYQCQLTPDALSPREEEVQADWPTQEGLSRTPAHGPEAAI